MNGLPSVLVTSPKEAGDEEDHADDREETAHEVDAGDDLAVGEAGGVHAGWWKIEDYGHDEPDEGPDSAKKTDISPARVGGDELPPEDRGAEGNDREDEDCDVFSTLCGWGQLGGCSKSGQFVDACSSSCQCHAGLEELAIIKRLLGGTRSHTDERVHRVRS